MLAGFDANAEGLLVPRLLMAGFEEVEAGRGFFVPKGVLAVGFAASLPAVLVVATGVFFAGVTPEDTDFEALLAEGSGFFVPMGVLGGVGFAAVFALVGIVVELGLVGIFTGVAVNVVTFEVVTGVAFFAGVVVLEVAVDVVLVAVEGDFFAVCCVPWATLEMFPTLAENY